MKNLFTNTDFPLDEIVFSGRNKSYGAYSLRQDSGKILSNATVYGLLLFGAVAALPFLSNFFREKQNNTHDLPENGRRVLVQVDRPDVVHQVTVHEAPQTKTFDSSVPTPTREPRTEKPAAKVSEYTDAVPAFTKTDGVTIPNIPTQIDVPGIPEPPVVTTTPKISENSVSENVDVEASFNGGINAFRDKVAASFNTSEFEGSGETLRATVTFIVEKDGTISSIKASGSDEKFNQAVAETIRRIRGKWQPAKLGGQNVRSYFRFPVAMQFE